MTHCATDLLGEELVHTLIKEETCMKIGKVYANAEREEDRADQTLIEMGVITGEGLLGKVIEAVDKLHGLIAQQGWYSESPKMLRAIEEARREYFSALKAIEEAP